MAIKYNTSIVRSGLVLHLDAANAKSYKNYNLATYSQDFANAVWSKSTGLITASALLAPDGTYTATTLTDDDTVNYESFSRGFIVQNDSASYNISVFIKKTTGGTSSRTGFNVFLSEGSTTKPYNIRFNADTGVATGGDSNLVTSETNNYWRLSFTVSNNSTGNTALTISYFPATGVYNGSDVTTATGSHTVWGLQITRGAELLPYKTNVNDNTNTWSDLSGLGNNGTLTNGPIYNSSNNGTMVFDGVNDYVTTPFATTSGQAVTYCGWLYSTETTAAYRNFVDSASVRPMIWWNTSGQIEFDAAYYTTTAVYRNQWVYVVLSKPVGSSSASYYVNGVLVGTGTAYTTPAVTPTWFNRAAGLTWKGNSSMVNVYNRVLSDIEISQNFEALRGRYGI